MTSRDQKLFNQPIAPLLSLSSILSFSRLVYLCQLLVEGVYEYSSQTYFSSKIACISPLPTTFLCHIIRSSTSFENMKGRIHMPSPKTTNGPVVF
jgi:hypothetical protein